MTIYLQVYPIGKFYPRLHRKTQEPCSYKHCTADEKQSLLCTFPLDAFKYLEYRYDESESVEEYPAYSVADIS